MQIIINENFNHPVLTRGKNEITKKIISGDNLKECFEKIYKLEKSARYNNYLRYKFIDAEMEKMYNEWERDSMTIEMFYGNATVD